MMATIVIGAPISSIGCLWRLPTKAKKRTLIIPRASNSKEDVYYVLKVGAGSVAGGAVIKYGSVLFPDITIPNFPLAIAMICAPVLVAALLMLKRS